MNFTAFFVAYGIIILLSLDKFQPMKPSFFALLCLFLLCACKGDTGVQTYEIADKSKIFKVTLDVLVQKDDKFGLYYTTDGSIDFAQNEPVWTDVKGNPATQKITLSLPQNQIPSQLRIDLGQNEQQPAIRLEKVWLSYKGKTVVFPGTLVFSYFRPDVKKTKIDATNGWVSGIVKDGKRQTPSLYPKEGPLGRQIDLLLE